MNLFLEIINVVLPVFLVIGLGYALGAIGFLTEAANDLFAKFVFWVSAPALLFRSVALAPLSATFRADAIGVAALASVLMAAIVYLVSARSGPSRRGVLAQGAYRSNMVFVGLPVITGALGDAVLAPAAVFFSFMTPVYNVLAVVVLAAPHAGGPNGGPDYRKAAKDVAMNPLILSCLAGLVWAGLSLPLPVALDVSLKLTGNIAMPLALVVIGASMDLSRLRSQWALPLCVSLAKLIVYPGMIYLGLWLVGATNETVKFTVLMMACPTAVVSHIMAREMKGDDQLAASVVIMTTLLSMATIAGWLALFKALGI